MFTNGHEMFFGWGFMWIFWVILFVAAAFIIKAVMSGNSRSDITRNQTPMEILKKRLANGEIDEQEFELKRKKLES